MTATPPFGDDPLARAEDAWRRAPVPDGPSEATVARILAALDAAAPEYRAAPRSWRIGARWLLRLAAAVVLGATLFYVIESLLHQPALGFGEVARSLRDAHSLVYRLTLQDPRTKKPVAIRCLFKEPGLIRSEGPDGHLVIADLRQGKTLFVEPASKSALLLEKTKAGGEPQPEPEAEVKWLERLRKLADQKGEPLGRKRIRGVEAEGFRVKDPSDGLQQDLVLWADPKTRRPVLIEGTVGVGDHHSHIAFSDFEFDPVLDPALFRLEPPPGYVLHRAKTPTPSPEEAVVYLLRTFAEASGGRFPPRLDDWAAYERVFSRMKPKGLVDMPSIKLAQSLIRAVKFAHEHKGAYSYETTGVRLGDAGKIIFWYRPQGFATYRVVYGDLRVGTVTADRLPAKPKQ